MFIKNTAFHQILEIQIRYIVEGYHKMIITVNAIKIAIKEKFFL